MLLNPGIDIPLEPGTWGAVILAGVGIGGLYGGRRPPVVGMGTWGIDTDPGTF